MTQRVYCTKKDDSRPDVSEIPVVAVRDVPNEAGCKKCVLYSEISGNSNACRLAPRNCTSDRLSWIHFEHA